MTTTPDAIMTPETVARALGLHALYGADHGTDAECLPYLSADDDTCMACGVWHAEPCPWCQQRGYHAPGCPDNEETTR